MTEVGTTKKLGDVGYVYKDGSRWTSVYMCEDGTEMDSSYSSKEKAKKSVVSELAEELVVLSDRNRKPCRQEINLYDFIN